MNQVSLFFYGDIGEVQHHLLNRINVLNVFPATENRVGFYISKLRYGGRNTIEKISLDMESINSDAVLLFRYLSHADIVFLKKTHQKLKFYILVHNFFDLYYIKDNVLKYQPQAVVIADYADSSKIPNYFDVKTTLKTANICQIKKPAEKIPQNKIPKIKLHFPVVILFLIKIFINPVNEAKSYAFLVMQSKSRFVGRFMELLIFLNFVWRTMLLKVIQIGWRTMLLRVIQIGYLVRHIFLISLFKSYGLVYDFCTLIYRIIKLWLLYPFFKIYWFTLFQYNKRIKKIKNR